MVRAVFRPKAELTQNLRYFCACAVKKSSNSEHVFWQKSYSPVTGNRGHRSERRGQIFDWKLANTFLRMRSEQMPKLAYYGVKSPKF